MVYSHLLVPTSFSEKCQHTIEHAKRVAEHHQAELSLVHFVEALAPATFPDSNLLDLDKTRLKAAKNKLNELSEALGIPKENRYITEGHPSEGIVKLAKKIKVDLIVLSNHSHDTSFKFFSSTAETITSHAPCDILIVR
jgi:nucleotide-binding universal stress UspA family protein